MTPDNDDVAKEVAENQEEIAETTETTENNEPTESDEANKEASEGEEGEKELDDDLGDDEQAAEQPKPSRAQDRIRKLASEAKAEREEKEKIIHERAVLQAQLEHLRQQQYAAQSAAEKKAEEERLALLDPQDRRMYEMDKYTRQLEYRLNQMELKRQDDVDRANFHAKASTDETYGKYADQVEQMYQEGLARGVSASREDLHSYILGKELKKDMASKTSKKKEAAGKRIESATAKPASAKGDVAGSKKGKTEEDRLRGVLI